MTDTTDTTPDLAELQAKLAEAVKGIDALKAKNEELLGEKKAAQKKAQEEADARQKAADEAAAKSGDVDALNKSWEAKLAKREAELAEAVKERDGKLFDLTVNAEARRIASELALPGSADVLLPHIKARLKYENGQVAVLDAEGKLSASTLDDLAKEIASDARFAPVIVGSRATGGGANGSHTRGGAAKTVTRSVFDGMAPEARMAHVKAGGTITD
jgi:chromosome segregation ATPase